MDDLDRAIPRGTGRGGVLRVGSTGELEKILLAGSAYAVGQGYGVPADLTHCEDAGAVSGADPAVVSARRSSAGWARWAASARATTSPGTSALTT
jgi:tRNA-splicing ligase RtcB